MCAESHTVFRFGLWILAIVGLGTGQALAGPNIQSWETANGARVLFVAAPEIPMLDLRVVFDAGSARDGGKPGLARLTAALVSEGAGEWNADQIAERVDGVGAELGASSLRDMAWVSMRSLTEPRALDTVIDTMASVVGEPSFANRDFERQRERMKVGLKLGEQSPDKVGQKAFYAAVFGDHPYAPHPGGTAESLQTIDREDVRAFHRRYYVARNAVVAMVGAVSREQAEAVAERVTARLASGEAAPALPGVTSLGQTSLRRIEFPSSQSHLFVGQPGIRRGDPDYFPLYVGNHILGGSGLISLLSEEIREKRGLSYSVYSHFVPMRGRGPFMVGLQTRNENAETALEVLNTTLRGFVERGPDADQLEAAKQNLVGGFPLRIDSNGKIVQYLAMIGFYDLSLDYLDTFVTQVQAVSAEQVRDAFRRRLSLDRLVTVIVGGGSPGTDALAMN